MALWVLWGAPVRAQEYRAVYAGADIHLDIQSYRERQFTRVIHQQTDFSCGSAALATLLTYHYGIENTEASVFKAMWDAGEQDKIRQRGFSLLDMQRYLRQQNIAADGYQLSLDKLEEIGVPAIALIDANGYKHFVVIKGIEGDRIIIGDPSAGLIVRQRAEFEAMWDGTIFFIRSYLDRGRAGWNTAEDWAAHPLADVRSSPAYPTLQERTLDLAAPLDSAFDLTGVLR